MTKPFTSCDEGKLNNNNNDGSNKDENAKKKGNDNSTRDIDGGWAWIVLLFSFIAAVISSGQFFNNGLYFYIFLNAFGESRSTTMWITAAQGASSGVAGIIASNLIVKFGNRKTMILGSITLGLSYGMMFFANSVPYAIVCFTAAGVGSALLLISNISSLGLYFKKKLGAVTGIVLAGAGLGTTIIGLEIEWAVATYGWRGAMLIQSALVFQICVCAATIYDVHPSSKHTGSLKTLEPSPVPLQSESEIHNSEDNKLKESKTPTAMYTFLSDVRFWIQIIAFTFYFASVVTTFQIMKDFVVNNNFSFSYSVVMVCIGVSNCIGRLSGGFLASLVTPTLLGSIVTILCGLSISMLLVTSVEWVILLGTVLYGFTNGLQGVPHTLSWAALFGQEVMAVVFGFSIASGVIPTLVMSPLVGYMIDETGSYLSVIILSSACMLVSGLLFLLTHVIHRRKLGTHNFDHCLHVSDISHYTFKLI